MRVFVTGASGLLGSELCERLLARGDEVTALSRKPQKSQREGIRWVVGDPAEAGPWCKEIDGQDAVVHLAGESIASGRWTRARKARLVGSRVESTRLIATAIQQSAQPPRTLVNASATGFYGSRGEELLDESSTPGSDFLAGLCRDWEAEALALQSDSLRVVCLRFAPVLSAEGGALANMLPAFRLGLGGPVGPRERWFPWVHEADAVGLTLYAIDTSRYESEAGSTPLRGPINVVAPGVVRMSEFARGLGKAVRRPAVIPVPLGLLRVPLGELADLLSPGQRVSSDLARASGYVFEQPTLQGALAACLH